MSEEKAYITLQQYLKHQGVVATGGEAKMMIQNGEVKVNGETETRRGKKLYDGDVVSVGGRKYVVAE